MKYQTAYYHDPVAFAVAKMLRPIFSILCAWAFLVAMLGTASLTARASAMPSGFVTTSNFLQSSVRGVCMAFDMSGQVSTQFSDGFSPSSMNSGNMPQSQVTYYDKNFVKNLKAETPYLRCSSRRELPEHNGNKHQLFMYQPLSANTTQAGDGVVGSGITLNVVSNASTIGNYADYINYSRLSLQTAIDPALENGSTELAYRLALSLSTLTKNTADGASVVDASVGIQNAYNVPFSKSNITTAVASMRGRNIRSFTAGKFCGVMHPFAWGDALNDNTNNSFTDVLKHTIEGQMKLEELPSGEDGESIEVMSWAGVDWYESSLVTITPGYMVGGGTGVTAYRSYIFGEDGVITISLGKEQGVGDGRARNLKMWTNTYALGKGGPSDPAGMIAGSTAYNVNFVSTLPPDPTQRLRWIDAPSLIT